MADTEPDLEKLKDARTERLVEYAHASEWQDPNLYLSAALVVALEMIGTTLEDILEKMP